jgi:signal transduction protein with GAF and PtsI domain
MSAGNFNPKDLEFFWKISESVVSGRYLQEILQLIVTMTAEMMNTQICSIMLLDEKHQELVIAATQAKSVEYIKKPNLKVSESLAGRAALERKPVSARDVTQERRYRYPDLARQEKIVSMLAVPMLARNRVIGVANVYTQEPHDFTETEIKVLQAVANQAAVAIENTKLQQEAVAARQELETRKLMNRAKAVLMKEKKITEDAAHRLLLRISRDRRKTVREVAEAILLTQSMT